jgi:hypothetical protein
MPVTMPSCQARAACRRCSWADLNVHGRAGHAVAAFCALPVVDPGRAFKLLVRCRCGVTAAPGRLPVAQHWCPAVAPTRSPGQAAAVRGPPCRVAVCWPWPPASSLDSGPGAPPGGARRAWATSWHRLGTAPSESAPTPSESIGCSSGSESELASDSQGDTNLKGLFFWRAVSLVTLCREGPFWPEGRHRAREKFKGT